MGRKLPTINNRSFKFDSKEAPKYYAAVKIYLETCRKNHINGMAALSR